MPENKTHSIFYDRRKAGSLSAVITTDFKDTLIDFGFNASHIEIEVVGGTCDVGFGKADVHAELDATSAPPTNPKKYSDIGVGKLYLKGTATDVKITAWFNGRS